MINDDYTITNDDYTITNDDYKIINCCCLKGLNNLIEKKN